MSRPRFSIYAETIVFHHRPGDWFISIYHASGDLFVGQRPSNPRFFTTSAANDNPEQNGVF